MKSLPHLQYSILSKQAQQERVTIELDKAAYDRLKEITDIKKVFIKDVIDELISIYNKNAITDKDFQNRVQEEKDKLDTDIKGLVDLQSQNQSPTPTPTSEQTGDQQTP